MNVLFDLTHPAHVHLFRNAIGELEDRGHTVRVTSRDKEITCELLDAYGIEHTPLSTKSDSTAGLAAEWAVRGVRTLRIARRFDPDAVVSVLSPVAATVARVLGSASVVFHDSENTHPLAVRATIPLADRICTPERFSQEMGPKQVRYEGFQELAYLHPNRFEADASALVEAGMNPDQPYFVLRFVSWGAHHDLGERGLSTAAKRRLVAELSERGSVYITSEGPIAGEFADHRLPVEPHLFHDLLACADLYVGDSGTTATEAAVLGVPAIRTNSFAGEDDMSNFVELEEEYGLLHSIPDEDAAIDRALALADDPTATDRWQRRRERLFADKIDVTRFAVRVILEASGPDSGESRLVGTATGSGSQKDSITSGREGG